jgi:hypothetical protein
MKTGIIQKKAPGILESLSIIAEAERSLVLVAPAAGNYRCQS